MNSKIEFEGSFEADQAQEPTPVQKFVDRMHECIDDPIEILVLLSNLEIYAAGKNNNLDLSISDSFNWVLEKTITGEPIDPEDVAYLLPEVMNLLNKADKLN